jgi:hypothetical protein
MRLLFAALVAIPSIVVVYAADRITASRAEREGRAGYHPLTLNHHQPSTWQWVLGAIALFAVAFGAADALGIG